MPEKIEVRLTTILVGAILILIGWRVWTLEKELRDLRDAQAHLVVERELQRARQSADHALANLQEMRRVIEEEFD